MNKVSPNPDLPVIGELFRIRLLDYLREFARSLNQAAEGFLWPSVAISTTYTAGEADLVIVASPSAPFTLTIPRASVMKGKRIVVKRGNNTTHTITVQSTSGNIDGAASTTLTTAWQSRELFSDGSQWLLV